MNHSPIVLAALTESLSAEADIAARLLSLLQEEAVVLAGNDHNAVLALSHRKQLLAEQLAESERVRCQRLGEIGLPTHLPVLEKALRDIGAEEASATCRNLKRTALACNERNCKNGLLVENRLQHTRRALEIITGRTFEPEGYGATYGQRGRVGRRSGGRSLALA